jgi:hypothetical protein
MGVCKRGMMGILPMITHYFSMLYVPLNAYITINIGLPYALIMAVRKSRWFPSLDWLTGGDEEEKYLGPGTP